MTTFDFDLIVSRDPTEEDANRLYEAFDHDVTPAVVNGVPTVMCSVEAEDFTSAVTSAVERVRELGFEVQSVQAEPESIAA